MESLLRYFKIPRDVNWQAFWYWIIGLASSALALLLAVILFFDVSDPPDLILLLGRFHPSIVHFPIGVLFLAVLLEASSYFYSFKTLRKSTSFVVTFGAVASVIAVVIGYCLSLSGGYNEELVGWHMWAGIIAAIGAVGASVLNILFLRKRSILLKNLYRGVLFSTVGILLYAGHLGGTLTHGPGYLTKYMPAGIKKLIGTKNRQTEKRDFPVIDEAVIYGDLVRPVLDKHCVECHGKSKKKGKLRLDSKQVLKKKIKEGELIKPGKPEKSELYRRITLPLYHDDVMPPEGQQPLGVGDTELIRWWIKNGASFKMKVSKAKDKSDIPPSVQTVLDRLSKPEDERKRGIYAFDVPPPDPNDVQDIRNKNIDIRFLSKKKRFLEVDLSDQSEPVKAKTIKTLKPVYNQITRLNLSGSKVSNSALKLVKKMKYLTKLNLRNTGVDSSSLAALSSLQHLQSLNLVGTNVDDDALKKVKNLKQLTSLYLWETSVSSKAVKQLQQKRTSLTVNTGAESANVDPSFSYLPEEIKKRLANKGKSKKDQIKRVEPARKLSDVLTTLQDLNATVRASSEQNEFPAKNVLDNNPKTLWKTRTKPKTDAPPHELVIDLKKNVSIQGISCIPRQKKENGRISKYSVFLSQNGSDWGEPAASGTWKNTNSTQTVSFSSPKNARYVKLQALSEVTGKKAIAVAEVGLIKKPKGKLMYRVNCATEDSMTIAEQTWRADQRKTKENDWGAKRGDTVDRGDVEIENTDMDEIFRHERYALSGYAFDVPNGRYTVRLLFAETFNDSAGARSFGVKIEGKKVLEYLDIFREAGYRTALEKIFSGVAVEDGTLDINFTRTKQAMINGIEIFKHEPSGTYKSEQVK